MAQIFLHVEPGVVQSWDEFQSTKPPFSIALDGYVFGQTKYSSQGPYANFNHHEMVDRLSTRSTCMQIFFSSRLGLFESFQKNGEPYAHVYVNDADQDVCLSYWLLKDPEKTVSIKWEEPLAKFLIIEDFLDASGGAFPYDDTDKLDSLLKKQAWVFEPYTTARSKHILHSMSGDQLYEIIEEICDRITLFAQSQSKSIDLDTKPKIIGGGPGWRMIIETSIYARTSIYASGIKAFVGMRNRNDGNYTYVIGKTSPYVPFPLPTIYDALNKAENIDSLSNVWGGSDIIGGSPRTTGSALGPKQVKEIINNVLSV
jgi:hypothetical protein